jgi:hypothetical protein
MRFQRAVSLGMTLCCLVLSLVLVTFFFSASPSVAAAKIPPGSNAPPLLSPLGDATFSEEITGSLAFEAQDEEAFLKDLRLDGSSSNPSVIPESGIVFTGVGRHRSVLLSPAQPGRTRITISASNGRGTATQSFEMTITPRAAAAPQMLLSAVVSEKPRPEIRLIFPTDPMAANYEVFRKNPAAPSWGESIAALPGATTDFTDTHIAPGSAYEYRVTKNASYSAYLLAGVRAPMTEDRGTLVLVVERSQASALQHELARLQRDLTGDGWAVIRHDVSRDDAPSRIKELIKREFESDPRRVKSIFLFGHVPIAYSGSFGPDGHHERAFPADVFYADMDGAWTDDSTLIVQSPRYETRNYANDGRYDPSTLPSDVELQIGRVDLFNLPAFLPKTETDLLRQYLDKDHNYRHGRLKLDPRGLADGWASGTLSHQSAMFGRRQVLQSEFVPALKAGSYVWASRAQYAHYRGFNDSAVSTASFASADLEAAFFELAGSYFGEWDIWDNFLRAPLGMREYGLAAYYAIPSWRCHPLALGETLGFVARLNQNMPTHGGLYSFNDGNARKVHIALMGDPTLRLYPVPPVTELTPLIRGQSVHLQWKEPETDVEGYLVYRSGTSNGPFVRRTSEPIRDPLFAEENLPPGNYTFMVRAVKLQVSGSGSYRNLSQGIFRTVRVGGAQDAGPPIVNVTTPPRGSRVYGVVGITASVRDDKGIGKVEFLIDGVRQATTVEPPFSFQWDTSDTAAGEHTITARATDEAGNTAQDMILITLVKSDSIAPSISLTEPTQGQHVWGNVVIRASAADNAAVDRVELQVDDKLLETAKSRPYDFIWRTYDVSTGRQTVADGVHLIKVTAFDRAGNQTHQSVPVTVDGALGRITILAASVGSLTTQAGRLMELTYRWEGGPAMQELMVFTDMVDASGKTEVADIHYPSVPTHYWSGSYSYPGKFRVKRSLPPGKYKLMSGLSGATRLLLKAGPGVTADEQNRYQIGEITVMPDTTPPKLVFASWRPGQSLAGRANLSVRATDNVAAERVDLLLDGQKAGTFSLSPNISGHDREISDNLFFIGSYVWDTSGIANGPHRMTLRVIDTSTNSGELELEVKVSNPVIEMATPSRLVARPGESIQLRYRWSGGTGPDPVEVITELIPETQRRVAFHSAHSRRPATASESATSIDLTYNQDLVLPRDLAPGTYQITVRMARVSGDMSGFPIPVGAGQGVTRMGTGANSRCVIGQLTVLAP